MLVPCNNVRQFIKEIKYIVYNNIRKQIKEYGEKNQNGKNR